MTLNSVMAVILCYSTKVGRRYDEIERLGSELTLVLGLQRPERVSQLVILVINTAVGGHYFPSGPW